MLASPAHGDLVRKTRHKRQQDNAGEKHHQEAPHAALKAQGLHEHIGRKHGEHDDGHDEHHDDERGAAAYMLAGERHAVLGRERKAMLQAVDGLVLRAVVTIHLPDVGHEGDKPHVQHEDSGAQHAIEQVPGNHVVMGVIAHDEVGHEGRHEDEEGHTQQHAQSHGDGHPTGHALLLGLLAGLSLLLGNLLGRLGARRLLLGLAFALELLGLLLVLVEVIGVGGGDAHGLVLQHERLNHGDAAAHERPLAPGLLLAVAGDVVLLHVDAALGLAHGDGPGIAAAHHDALEHGGAADVGLEELPGGLVLGISHCGSRILPVGPACARPPRRGP